MKETILPRYRTLRRAVIHLFVAGVICLGATQLVPAAIAADGKLRRNADKALREGEYEVAEKMFRELLDEGCARQGGASGSELRSC